MRTLALLLVLLLTAAGARAQPALHPPGAEPKLPPIPDLNARLEALHPAEPMAYFRLAEGVADEATTPEHQHLARTLYILSMTLQPDLATADITPSVCLGLAALAPTPDERRWLRAMADSLTRRDRLEPDWSPPGPEASPQRAALDLASAVGLIRAGEGARAERLLEDPAVLALIRKMDFIMRDSGVGLHWLRTEMQKWRHCPQCFERRMNQRIVPSPGSGYILCPTCGGNPGPVLTIPQLLGQLRFESLLLDGVNRSWSAQHVVDLGAPLRDLDPTEIPGTYGVDVDRPLWRDGSWVPDPDRPAEPEPAETDNTAEPADGAPTQPGPDAPEPLAPSQQPGQPPPSNP